MKYLSIFLSILFACYVFFMVNANPDMQRHVRDLLFIEPVEIHDSLFLGMAMLTSYAIGFFLAAMGWRLEFNKRIMAETMIGTLKTKLSRAEREKELHEKKMLMLEDSIKNADMPPEVPKKVKKTFLGIPLN